MRKLEQSALCITNETITQLTCLNNHMTSNSKLRQSGATAQEITDILDNMILLADSYKKKINQLKNETKKL